MQEAEKIDWKKFVGAHWWMGQMFQFLYHKGMSQTLK